MSHRDTISIKTKYLTVEDCREQCIDKTGKVRYASTMGKSLIGQVDKDNSFCIGSNQKNAATHEFVGKIIQKDGAIYMEGQIRPRKFSQWITYLGVILGFLFGIGLIFTWNPVFIFFGMLFMIVPWLNIIHLKKSNALYNLIIKKVT